MFVQGLITNFAVIVAPSWCLYCEVNLSDWFDNHQDQVVGVALCDLHDKNQPELEKDGVFPQKFHQLERFFDDLKSPCDLFEKVKISSLLLGDVTDDRLVHPKSEAQNMLLRKLSYVVCHKDTAQGTKSP